MLVRVRSFTYGFSLPFRAARLIGAHPSLLVWSILPVLITLALYGWLVTWLNAAIGGMIVAHTSGVAAWIIAVLTKILLFLVAAVTFSFVAGIAACPFNDFLAEAAERFSSPPLLPVRHHSVWIKLRLIAIDMTKTLAATFAMILAFALSFIPVVNFITFLAAFLLFAFQYISYPQTRRALGAGEGFRFIGRHPFACLGFGFILSLLFSVPFVSCFSLPLAVVGGTLLYARAGDAEALPLR